MSTIASSLLATATQFLAPDDREALLGDSLEAGETPLQTLRGIASLLLRRQVELWRTWQPWLAGFGLTLPLSFVLMGCSVCLSTAIRQAVQPEVFITMPPSTPSPATSLALQLLLLAGFAWTAGFTVTLLSRRTLWISAALCCSPCLFCLSRFRIASLPRVSLFLFLAPAIVGVYQAVRGCSLSSRPAITLALALTLLTTAAWLNTGFWAPHLALLSPAWYLAVTAPRSATNSQFAGISQPM